MAVASFAGVHQQRSVLVTGIAHHQRHVLVGRRGGTSQHERGEKHEPVKFDVSAQIHRLAVGMPNVFRVRGYALHRSPE